MNTELEIYKQMYLLLFNAVTDALELIETEMYDAAADGLRKAQRLTEELYISAGEE